MKARPVGKTEDAGWQIGVSRTIDVDLDTAWDYLVSDDGLEAWLGFGVETPLSVGQTYETDDGTTGEVRSVRNRDRVRLTWQPADRAEPATIQIAITPAASGCTFQFHTEHLADGDDRERMRTHWKDIATRIKVVLSDSPTTGPRSASRRSQPGFNPERYRQVRSGGPARERASSAVPR